MKITYPFINEVSNNLLCAPKPKDVWLVLAGFSSGKSGIVILAAQIPHRGGQGTVLALELVHLCTPASLFFVEASAELT